MVSFNIQHGRDLAGGFDSAVLARYCAGLGADVLGLQEVDIGVGRSGGVDQVAAIAAATGMGSAFGRVARVGLFGKYGNALLVRGALHDVEVLALPRAARQPRRAVVLARAQVGDQELSVAVAHLAVTFAESCQQLRSVVAALCDRPLPRVLLGDFNLAATAVTDILAESGLCLADPVHPTFPASAPRARIDHVAAAGFEFGSVEVLGPAPVSDHRALAVEVS